MSRLDELIVELTSQGVEFKTLGEVTSRCSNIKWRNVDERVYRYIDLSSVDRVTRQITDTLSVTAGTAPSRAQQVVRTGDVIFATTRPTQMRWAIIPADYDGQIASTGYCVLRPDNDVVLTNFLAHLLGSDAFREYVQANQVEGNYPSIPDSRVRDFRIPVPPLEVQREIARILDQFTQLEAELEAELEARRRQYEHYRKNLLVHADANWQSTRLDELFDLRAGSFVPAAEIVPKPDHAHPIPCYGGGGLRGYVPAANRRGDLVLIGRQGALCGNVKRATGEFYATEHSVVVTPKGGANIRWAFHLLTSMNLNQYASKSAQPGLAVGTLNQLVVDVPPLDEQLRVGSILDRFDALVNDLSVGLPAELAARRIQYEYYRDRLLTFEEAPA